MYKWVAVSETRRYESKLVSKSIVVGVVMFVLGLALGRASLVFTSAPASPQPIQEKPKPADTLRGTVAEVIQVPQYSYLRLESGEWAAVDSASSLAVGQLVVVHVEDEMKDFFSPTLNRTFPRIWFGALEGAPRAARPNIPAPVPEMKAALQAVESSGTLTFRVVDVFTERAVLAGKRVKVKGTVDRVNFVQGVYYVHLKDGTGAEADKTDDLLCISSVEVTKGSQVTMEGFIALDKNVGMGVNPVVLDSAKLSGR